MPSGAEEACARRDGRSSEASAAAGGGTDAACGGNCGAVRGRLAALADTPVRISCALLYWSVRREITTVGSWYSR